MKLAILALAASANAFTSPSSAARPAATSLKAATATLPATVKPGVVTGDALMDLLAYAKERGFAIPAVNAVSSCGINACLEAAAKFEPAYVQFFSPT
jgi:fructose-bisphosphate aldolase class II